MNKVKKVIVDSSVIVKWLSGQDEKYLDRADKLLQNCQLGKISLHSPELAKYEVGNALLYKQMDAPATYACLALLYSLPITYYINDQDSADTTMEIAQDHNITYYDAVFLQLAQRIGGLL